MLANIRPTWTVQIPHESTAHAAYPATYPQVAGTGLRSGRRGRRFKSGRPDQVRGGTLRDRGGRSNTVANVRRILGVVTTAVEFLVAAVFVAVIAFAAFHDTATLHVTGAPTQRALDHVDLKEISDG